MLGFKKGMVIASNVNSLPLHLDKTDLLLKEEGTHFLCLNETKSDLILSDNLFKMRAITFKDLKELSWQRDWNFCRDTFNCDSRNDIPK